MAIGAYTKTTWANSPSTSTPVNDDNLNHIEDQVKELTDAAVSGGASPTKIWTSTNDGNGGQPPAPKPQSSSDTAGLWSSANSATCATGRSGGTYAVIAFDSSGAFLGAIAGVAQGVDLTSYWAATAKHMYFRT